LRIAMIVDKPLISHGFLDRVQVRSLYVLDDRDLQRDAVVDVAENDRDLAEAGKLRCAPTAFARDDLVPPLLARRWSHHAALIKALLTHRRRPISKLGLAESPAWLWRIGRY